jgi:hypothetical protein
MNVARGGGTAGGSEQGASIVELLIATTAALVLAALCGQTFAAYHTAYRSAVTRINHVQQAEFAIALISAELESIIDGPGSTGCPDPGLQLAAGRMAFSANLYDRSAAIHETAPAGARDLIVEPGSAFEAGDVVRLTNVGVVADPSDDVSQCVRIITMDGDHILGDSVLIRSFPKDSPVTLVNRVLYRLDEAGRLMRTQDGGTQRIANDIRGFDVSVEGRLLTIELRMRDTSSRTRRLVMEHHR